MFWPCVLFLRDHLFRNSETETTVHSSPVYARVTVPLNRWTCLRNYVVCITLAEGTYTHEQMQKLFLPAIPPLSQGDSSIAASSIEDCSAQG
jgi:hypothetical protein